MEGGVASYSYTYSGDMLLSAMSSRGCLGRFEWRSPIIEAFEEAEEKESRAVVEEISGFEGLSRHLHHCSREVMLPPYSLFQNPQILY